VLLLVCFRRLLLFVPVLLVATHANFSAGLIFAVEPLTGRIRPALHACRKACTFKFRAYLCS
jgi:hypothetical protein